jgi:RHS repeat-associated protein
MVKHFTAIEAITRHCLVTLGLLLAPTMAQAQDVVVFFHTDAIGSVRVVTDATGAVIHRYDYLPFGEPWNPPPNADTRRFAGGELDGETTFNYFGARYYRPQSGLFTTGDPGHAGGDIFNPQSWNAYSYVLNNPLRFVDPFGFAPCPAPTDISTCVEGRRGTGEFAYDWTRWVLETWLRDQWHAIRDEWHSPSPIKYGVMPVPPVFRLGGLAVSTTRNTIPKVVARVIPGGTAPPTLGRLSEADVFVTAAEDIAGLSASQLSKRLGIRQSNTYTVIEFPAPRIGIASPVYRTDPGFVGRGFTTGGAREFVIPNGPIPPGAVIRVVR